jgi:pimeloyl-ACP methyl ester carboxylesterase
LVNVGGYRLHIRSQGDRPGSGGPTVVMEGALSESSVIWGAIPQQVAAFARVCTYDRAGLGWSERGPKPRTASNITEELHALLTEAGVEPPYVLVGHSIGGLLVRLYAHRHPGEVAGMVLVDSTHEEQDLRMPASVQRLTKTSQRMMGWVLGALGALNRIGILALFAGKAGRAWPTPIPAQARETYLGVVFSSATFFKTAVEENASVAENLAAARAQRISTLGNIPLIVLSAGRMPLTGAPGVSAADLGQLKTVIEQFPNELAALSPQGKRVIAEKSGHYIPVDQPELVVDAIRQVVEAVQRA